MGAEHTRAGRREGDREGEKRRSPAKTREALAEEGEGLVRFVEEDAETFAVRFAKKG